MTPSLADHLARALITAAARPLVVAYSGGPDSTALLHALATATSRPALRALHVDHGLQAESGEWAAHCRRFCDAIDVPLDVLRVGVDLTRGEGVEAAARRARHAALAASLRPEEWLVMGHHRDDQAETVLLKLLRGAGPEGLAGMRSHRPLAAGTLWRPLLDLPRTSLLAHVADHALATIDDPSNRDPRIARGHLRGVVIPALLAQWPQAVTSITHSARLCRDAADGLREHWMGALVDLARDDDTLDAAGWLDLPAAWRVPLLEHWLHRRGLAAPTTAQRDNLERQAREASAERLPVVGWMDTEIRIWRGRLWAMRRRRGPHHGDDGTWSAAWSGESLPLPRGGRLSLSQGRLSHALTVRYRSGGETIKPHGDRHTRELRDLLQRDGVPPWIRPRLPLIFDGDRLVAIADRWRSSEGNRLFDASGGTPMWHDDD